MSQPSLFADLPPAPPAPPVLSAGQRLTARQRADVAAGRHPLTRGPLLGGLGVAAGGASCGGCVHRVLHAWHNRRYPKCVAHAPLSLTHGAATDVRAWWPACPRYTPRPERGTDIPSWKGGEPVARIRTIKPQVRTSRTVASWPFEVRLAWLYLWPSLDDQGRSVDDIELLKAELFPLDAKITPRRLSEWLQLMASTTAGRSNLPPLCRYEVDGRRYLHATGWEVHQRPNKPRPSDLPPCPVHEGVSAQVSAAPAPAPSGSVPEAGPERSRKAPGAGRAAARSVPGAGTEAARKPPGAGTEAAGRAPVGLPGGIRNREVVLGAGSADAARGEAEPEPERPVNGRVSDPVWDALLAACQVSEISSSARGAYARAVKDLRELGASPAEIQDRARRYGERFPRASLTPSALARHWGELAPATRGQGDTPGWEFGHG